jgi:hypothetical protein
MARDRVRRSRIFRPSLDGAESALTLESRQLLAAGRGRVALLNNHNPTTPRGIPLREGTTPDFLPKSPRAYVQTGVANGGQAAMMIDTDGEIWVGHLVGGGVVRAKAAPRGQVDLFLYGTSVISVLTIDPTTPTLDKNTAHIIPRGIGDHDALLHIRNITVFNGKINSLLGYRTADISGRIRVVGRNSPNPFVERIAFYALRPGASIEVAGDLNTLELFDAATMSGGPGIQVGRDLNWFNIGSTLTLQDGASIRTGRDIGLTAQPAKGSGKAGQGGLITGDLIVGPGSTIATGRFIDAPIIVQGSSFGISNLAANVQAATAVGGNRG